MPDSQNLEKAELRELDADFKNEINTDKKCQVQFNPDSLKVSFANQVATPSGAGDQKGTPARQFVGAGTTKLSLQLWFDVTAPMPPGQTAETDVRKRRPCASSGARSNSTELWNRWKSRSNFFPATDARCARA